MQDWQGCHKRLIATVLLAGVMSSACSNVDYYSPLRRHSAPQRWPDPVRVCTRGTTVVSKLRLAVGIVYVPESLGKACDPTTPGGGFRESDDLTIGGGLVDPSGIAEYAMSYYRLQLDSPAARRRGEGLASESVMPVLNKAAGVTPRGDGVRFWRHHEEIYSRDETINGRVWKHYAFSRYDSPSEDPTKPGTLQNYASVDLAEPVNNARAVFDITEVYVHEIDEGHAILATGRYDRMVIEDPEWYASRKALLERMVRLLEINAVTDEQVQRARASYEIRRAAGRSRNE